MQVMQSITTRAPSTAAPRQGRAQVVCRAAIGANKQQAPQHLALQVLQQGAALCASMLVLTSGELPPQLLRVLMSTRSQMHAYVSRTFLPQPHSPA